MMSRAFGAHAQAANVKILLVLRAAETTALFALQFANQSVLLVTAFSGIAVADAHYSCLDAALQTASTLMAGGLC